MNRTNKKKKGENSPSVQEDERWMRLALEWAARGEGTTRPNPPVGAVVVKEGSLISAGYHRRAGAEHAERMALRKAGTAARGATLYVTLEPCSTQGRTPPCTECIIEYGVSRVVVAVPDTNPKHHRRGIALLRRAGIEVSTGIGKDEATALLAPFTKYILEGKPLLSLKMAMTANGMIADTHGASRWITGPEARKSVQHLRLTADAILVGVGTVLADDPSLLPRPAHGRKPWRIIVDSHARIPLSAQMLNDKFATQTVVAVTKQAEEKKVRALERLGATVLRCQSEDDRVDLSDLLGRLGAMGLLHVLCEGGGTLAGELVKCSLVDRLYLFIAPSFLGASGIPVLQGTDWNMADKPEFHWKEVQSVGKDVLLVAKRK